MMTKKQGAMLCVCLGVTLVLSGPMRRAAADTPQGLYLIESGEVLDTQTGLVWQQISSASTMSWSEAKRYCGAPWRLPSMKELQTLVDETKLSPAMDTSAFTDVSDTSENNYWSSSRVAGLSSYAWFVRLDSGYTDYGDVTEQFRVRCVR